jgi:hypothetical protein
MWHDGHNYSGKSIYVACVLGRSRVTRARHLPRMSLVVCKVLLVSHPFGLSIKRASKAIFCNSCLLALTSCHRPDSDESICLIPGKQDPQWPQAPPPQHFQGQPTVLPNPQPGWPGSQLQHQGNQDAQQGWQQVRTGVIHTEDDVWLSWYIWGTFSPMFKKSS